MRVSLQKKNLILAGVIVLIIFGVSCYMAYHAHIRAIDEAQETNSRLADKRALLTPKEDDYVRNPGGAVTMIVYEDTDCEFCEGYMKVVESVMDHNPDVSVVFRSRVLPIYPRSYNEGLYLECIRRLAPQYYVSFTHDLFTIDSTAAYDEGLLLSTAAQYADNGAVASCVADSDVHTKVQATHTISSILGVGRVPHTFVFSQNSPIIELEGTHSEQQLQLVIDQVRAE